MSAFPERWRQPRPLSPRMYAALGGVCFLTLASIVYTNSSADTCLSPATLSPTYPGDRYPTVTNDQRTWRLGILATTPNPPRGPGYIGLVVSFKDPADATATWHSSKPVPGGDAGNPTDTTILLRIGPRDVLFKAQAMGEAGSPVCLQAPATEFSDARPLEIYKGLKVMQPSW